MKYIIDVTIILDFLTKREGFYEQSKKVYLLSVYGIIEGYLTANMITDIYYILERYGVKNPKIELDKLLNISRVLPVSGLDCINALKLEGNDFEDNLIVAIAQKHGVRNIITRNAQDFANTDLIVYSPEEIVEKYSKKDR
ncbi:type II toxin-antitoxin system VapC family toxin [Enterococcus pallens]|uniref:PIN domain-containing protein n=1 Tax=Enterococcus pallens ATCC BAA-351 TaxID=1158607 RepID=R2Q9E2_9ENTE|nr:PIN domain-containing protein [Enterococcus pallens]EOH93052.1 hypothetical protein UAU_02694 [Enterococcus pallens ATCC BAA-351]EOU24838.1 hypothetical protein I588_00825 [Enterococcus pallens ATCC BAA-351]